MKRCYKCKRTLAASKFSKCRSNKDGLLNRCKDCDRAYYFASRKPKRAKKRAEKKSVDGCPRCRADSRGRGTSVTVARWRWLPRSRWWKIWEKRSGQWEVHHIGEAE